jgi:RNA polymerase sigma-70 factor (ECF subfamily)
MDDHSIIEQVRRGHTQAFEALVLRYQLPLFRYLGRMGLASETVEDLVQHSFLRAFQHLPRFDPDRARFSTWLFTIARRLALNALTRRGSRVPGREAADQTDHGLAAPEQIDQAVVQQRVRQALAQLPPRLRSPLALAYLGDLSIADIARVEGCSEGTVKSRIYRGKQRLRILLADLIGDHEHA